MRQPAFVVLVVALCMVRPSARQVEPLPSLTNADRELIAAVLRDANWRDSEVASGATLDLAEQTVVMCVAGKPPQSCIDARVANNPPLARTVRNFDELRTAFSQRNQRTWRVGPLTMAPSAKEASTRNRVVRVSAPGFSADGKSALLYIWSGDRCLDGSDGSGGGTMISAERNADRWLLRGLGTFFMDADCVLPPQPFSPR